VHADQHPGNYLFQPDGRIGLIDFGCVKRVSIDVLELHRSYRGRVWRRSEASARQFLRMIYGVHVSYARARKILPIFEKWCDVFYPEDPNADIIIDFAKDPRWSGKMKEIQRELINRTLRDKLINPEFAFVTRADMGLRYLLQEIRAKINFSEIIRRVCGNGI